MIAYYDSMRMWKRWLLGALTALALAACYFFVYPFGIVFGLWQPLIRPAGVSRNARYVSIIEDASWLDCSIDAQRNVNVCRVWDPWGRLRTEGDFRYEDEPRAATKDELYPSAFGGRDTIYLFDGSHGHTIFAHALNRVGTQVKATVN
jgi:hypothetical protein